MSVFATTYPCDYFLGNHFLGNHFLGNHFLVYLTHDKYEYMLDEIYFPSNLLRWIVPLAGMHHSETLYQGFI